MPSSADIPRRDILILDTGPIWELVLYRAVNNLGFEMPIELVAQVGVIDGTVLQLGLRFAQFRPQILTVDWALAKECRRAGLHATHLTEIVA